MLHNNNKASIKVFEVYTGVKLAKNQRAYSNSLKQLQRNDYKGMQEFAKQEVRTYRKGT